MLPLNPSYFIVSYFIANSNFFSSVELQKANLEETDSFSSPNDGACSTMPESSLSPIIPLAQLFTKPDVINALSSLTVLNGITELLGALSGINESALIQDTGVHCSKTIFKRNHSTSADKKKVDEIKYFPY